MIDWVRSVEWRPRCGDCVEKGKEGAEKKVWSRV